MKRIFLRMSKILIPIVLLSILFACSGKEKQNISAQKKRELANVYFNQQLFEQSVKEYTEYLEDYQLDAKEQANISYMVGNIYFDKLHDYENALAYYLRVKYLFPESNLQGEVSKKVVACLERLKRSMSPRGRTTAPTTCMKCALPQTGKSA